MNNLPLTMKRYIYTCIAGLFLATGMYAQQQDSLLRRQIELQREFNPTLQDANKISSLPSRPQPTVKKANTAYSTWTERVTPPLEIALPKPGEKMTTIPFRTQKGYLTFGAGNYANMDGAFGYRLIETERDALAFSFLHQSTNGDIDYVQKTDPSGNNAYLMDNFGRLEYGHLFEAFKLDLHASYLHSLFNYYGNPFDAVRTFDNAKQRLGVLNANIAIQSVDNDVLHYRGHLDYKNFNTKFGITTDLPGIKGHQLDAGIGLDKPFQDGDSKIGLNANVLSVIYDEALNARNYLLLNGNPYLHFEGLNWGATLGVDVLFQSGGGAGTKVRVAPNVDLHWNVTEFTKLYATVKGGFDSNTYLDMINESRYIAPSAAVKPSFTLADVEAGVKIGDADGFRFDLFGGYKMTDDEHFLVSSQSYKDLLPPEQPTPEREAATEALIPVYGSLTRSFVGGAVHSQVWSPLEVSLRIKKNFYTVKDASIYETPIDDAKAWNLPGYEIDARAVLQIIPPLKLSLNYYLAGDRQTYFRGENIQMSAINDLNAGAVYDILPSLSIHLKANNLLFQKYDRWHGYAAQGLNVLGGFTFTF